MRINELFNNAEVINKQLNGQLLEISVKRHQVTISFKEPLIYLPNLQKIIDMAYVTEDAMNDSFISILNDTIYLTLEGLSTDKIQKKDVLYVFMETIEEFYNKICTCPALEFIISNQYIKCFLDKPGLTVDNLVKYEEILEADGKGELELHPQRPYLLFINENYEV